MERDYDDVSTESEEEVFDRQNFDCYPNYRRFKRGVLSTEELKDQEGIKRGKYDDKAERFTGHTLSYKILEAIQNEDLERVLMLLDRMKEKGLRLITPEMAINGLDIGTGEILELLEPFVASDFWVDEGIWERILEMQNEDVFDLVLGYSQGDVPKSICGHPFKQFVEDNVSNETILERLCV